MLNVSEEQIRTIGRLLGDEKRPLKERFRALFTLRNIGGPIAIECIRDAFDDGSALLKHELAYCLGQMQDESAIGVLVNVLEDRKQEPMVRHEAAEALGAIGSEESLEVLRKFADDPVQEVRETCELALDRIKWLHSAAKEKDSLSANPYNSVDPAPPMATAETDKLKTVLLDETASLSIVTEQCSRSKRPNQRLVLALCEALKHGSALFRHEIAFVLGQLQDDVSVPYLKESLCDREENEMVRHECAEALGAIATPDCLDVLNEYLGDEKRVVKESCEIALDMCEYENSPEVSVRQRASSGGVKGRLLCIFLPNKL